MMTRWKSFSLMLLSFAAVAGCGGGTTNSNLPPLVKVTGIVRYQGQPVEGADVTFNNVEAGYTALGTTDAAGKFTLQTSGEAGVVAGQQVVAIRRVDVINNTPADVDVSAGGAAVPPTIRWIVPEKYSNPKTSGLTAEVKADGTNDIPFDLQ